MLKEKNKYKWSRISQLISIAIACELVHSASLMYDDVVDNAKFEKEKFQQIYNIQINSRFSWKLFMITDFFNIKKFVWRNNSSSSKCYFMYD